MSGEKGYSGDSVDDHDDSVTQRCRRQCPLERVSTITIVALSIAH